MSGRGRIRLATVATLCIACAGCGPEGGRAADAGAAAAVAPAAEAERSADEAFTAFMEEIYRQRLDRSPMLAARVGSGEPTAAWDDLSAEAMDAEVRELRANLERLRTQFDPARLDAHDKIQYRVLEDELELLIERHRWRDHFYPLNQIIGLHLRVPNALTDGAAFDDAADARRYIARIEAVEHLFDQLVTRMQARADRGFLMPESLYPRLLDGARKVIAGAPFDEGSDNPVWSDFNSRLETLALDPDLEEELRAGARQALLGPYRSGYEQLIARLEAGQARTDFDGGVWQLPNGAAFYDFLLRQFTTTDMTAEEVHALGLREVERIHGEMRAIMEEVGFEGSLDEFFEFMRTDPRFYYENTDEGRAKYLARARGLVDAVNARIEQLFYEEPAIPLEVRRFEAYREKSAPGAFYEPGSPDGSRPGVFYLNLYDMSSVPTYALAALTFHETIPGHHMQISTIQTDPAIPELRKLNFWWMNTAFVEGWALYAEELASELGFYEDPYADFGRLSGALWRACRLVVDTGLHAKHWTREQTIEYLDANTPRDHASNVRAVDRYIAVPGQATSFMVGMHRILEARTRARAELGDAFDIRGFLDAVLRHGYVPLWAMEESVQAWTQSVRQSGESDRS